MKIWIGNLCFLAWIWCIFDRKGCIIGWDIQYFVTRYHCYYFFAVILQVEISMLSVHIVFYLTLRLCDMLIKVKTTQTSQNNLLIPTCILSLLLNSTTSFPYLILAILAMYFISCWSPSHYHPQNLQETLSWPTKCPSWTSSKAFWG